MLSRLGIASISRLFGGGSPRQDVDASVASKIDTLSPDSPEEAERLKDRYRIGEPIGEGATAKVYRVYDETLGVWRAVKILTTGNQPEADTQRRFRAEARAMAQLGHPNILQIYDVGAEDDRSYIIMALADQGSLQDRVDRAGPLPRQVAISYALQLLSALSAAHAAGIIHRDVKPQNVLLDADGVALLADFGIAMLAQEGEQRQTQTGMGMGSMAFMAPEQRLDARDVDAAADLYSVGASLYYLATGANPIDLFAAGEGSPRWEGLDPALRAVIQRATRYEPGDRYPDASAMAMELVEVLQNVSAISPFETRAPEPLRVPGLPDAGDAMSPRGRAVTHAAIGFLTEGPHEGPFAASGGFYSPARRPAGLPERDTFTGKLARLSTGAIARAETQFSTKGQKMALAWTLLSALLLSGVLWWTNDYTRRIELGAGLRQDAPQHMERRGDLEPLDAADVEPAQRPSDRR